MRVRAMVGLAIAAAGAAALVLATAAAGVPPSIIVRIAVTHGQPAAGTPYTGLAFTPVGGARITKVVCDAHIGRTQLRGRQQRFYADGVSGSAVVTCGWRIPAGTAGKRLSLSDSDGRACVFLVQEGGQSSTVCTPVLSWRIKP